MAALGLDKNGTAQGSLSTSFDLTGTSKTEVLILDFNNRHSHQRTEERSVLNRTIDFALRLGPLRWMLLALALMCVLLAPPAGTPPAYEGWSMVPTLLVPVTAPLVVLILLLDTFMARLFRSAGEPRHRGHYSAVTAANLASILLLAVTWTPYFLALTG